MTSSDRHLLDSLALYSISSSTRRAYASALKSFLQWAESLTSPFPSSYEALDRLLAQFIQHQYQLSPRRGSRQLCVNLRAGILFIIPWAKHSLLLSSRFLHGWDRLQLPTRRLPIPHEVLVVLLDFFLHSDQLDIALFLALSFYGMLRISECLAIDRRDVSASSGMVCLRLPVTKTGRDQSVTITQPIVCQLFSKYDPHRSRLFEHLSARKVRTSLSHALTSLNLDPSLFSPHSLRHGGATLLFQQGVPVSDIAMQGRWASQKTLKRYVQSGKSNLISLHLPPAFLSKASQLFSQFGMMG